jgi:hypothetical protein
MQSTICFMQGQLMTSVCRVLALSRRVASVLLFSVVFVDYNGDRKCILYIAYKTRAYGHQLRDVRLRALAPLIILV